MTFGGGGHSKEILKRLGSNGRLLAFDQDQDALLNRIDDIIMFTPLTKSDIFEIVKLQLAHLKKMIGKQDIYIDATDEAIEYLARKGYQPEFGARPVKRVIQKEVLNQLSKDILSGKVTTDSIILLDAFDDQLVFRNQSDLVQN